MNQSNRIATLLFLHSREEISSEEEMELKAWRETSPENEQLFRELGDPEYVRSMMADLYKGREIVYDNMKVRFSYLSDSKLSDEVDLAEEEKRKDFPEKDIAESGLSKAEFWESLLSEVDLSKTKTQDEYNKQNGFAREAKIVPLKKNRPGRYKRILLRGAAILLLVLVIDLFLPGSKYKNFEATMISSDGVKIIFDDFYRGFKAGRAGITFGKTDNGEPIYIAADERKARNDKFYELITPPGGEFILQLPDGTLVWINAASKIKYPANFNQDTIRIEVEGEVYIQRSKDNSHTFLINRISASAKASADKLVNGQGSTIQPKPSSNFNINTYPGNDEMLVTLIRGAAGQQTLIIHDSLALTHDVNAEEIIAWKNGEFYYKDAALTIMMPAIANWYDVDIQFTGQVPDKKFSLRMPRSVPISEVLESLQKQGLHITRQGKAITIWK
jgi:hypothetical protein